MSGICGCGHAEKLHPEGRACTGTHWVTEWNELVNCACAGFHSREPVSNGARLATRVPSENSAPPAKLQAAVRFTEELRSRTENATWPTLAQLLDYYGLRQQPFGVTPDPACLYPARTHRDALASLHYAIAADRGFAALVAPPGMGKTTLLYQLMDQLRDSARVVFLFHTQCDSRELFRYILQELGVDSAGMDAVAMHEALNQMLFSEMLEGKRFVLIVDEAQNLEPQVLETIRLLSNFETPHAKLLQIILSGQPQLGQTLAEPQLAQLSQRISVLARLEPLNAAETSAYVEHRLRLSGYAGVSLFTPGALAVIAQRSQGIPRNINNLCFHALSLGYTRRRQTITSDVVREAAAQLDIAIIAGPSHSNGDGATPKIASVLPFRAAASMSADFAATGTLVHPS
jgi:general secretion pathway protein A